MSPEVELIAAPSEGPDLPDDAGKLDDVVADVECPWCERPGKTIHELNICDGCGAWFLVKA